MRTVDGHSFESLEGAFADVGGGSQPWAVIANTVRGKGVPSIEEKADRWFVNLTQDELASLQWRGVLKTRRQALALLKKKN